MYETHFHSVFQSATLYDYCFRLNIYAGVAVVILDHAGHYCEVKILIIPIIVNIFQYSQVSSPTVSGEEEGGTGPDITTDHLKEKLRAFTKLAYLILTVEFVMKNKMKLHHQHKYSLLFLFIELFFI